MDSIAINSLNKFNNYLDNYINNLQVSLRDITKQIDLGTIIESIKSKQDVQSLIDAKSTLLSIDNSLDGYYKIIEFFSKKGFPNVTQVKDATLAILNASVIQNYNSTLEKDKKRKNDIETSIALTSKLKESALDNFEHYCELLENSDLSDKEKINVYTIWALRSTVKPKIKENAKEEENIDIKKYQETITKSKIVINKYYADYISGKSEKEKDYARNFAKSMDNMEIEKLMYPSEVMFSLLLNLIDNKNKLEECLKQAIINKDDLELYNMDIEKNIEGINSIDHILEEEKVVIYPSNVMFLLDESNNPYFAIDINDDATKNALKRVIEKLENGLYDYINIKKPYTKLKTETPLPLDVFVNRIQNVACAFVRVNNTSIIISTAKRDEIYEYSEKVARDNLEKINTLKEQVKQGIISPNDERQQQIKVSISSSFERGVNNAR